MTIVAEVADGLKIVSDGVRSIRTIREAIEDAHAYLEAKHPDVREDVAALCAEMRKTAQAIAAATAIITHFRFQVGGDPNPAELSRFNDYLITNKGLAGHAEEQLHNLRGHCHVIRDRVASIEQRARRLSIGQVLGLTSREREKELAEALQAIYDDEMEYYRNVYSLKAALGTALGDIEDQLGPPGAMLVENIPAAARVLGEYAAEFGRLEAEANHAAFELQTTIDRKSVV